MKEKVVENQYVFELKIVTNALYQDNAHVEFSSFSLTANGGRRRHLEIPKFKSLKKVNWSISRKPSTHPNLAAKCGYVDIAKVLIQNGADVNAVMKRKWNKFNVRRGETFHAEPAYVLAKHPGIKLLEHTRGCVHSLTFHGIFMGPGYDLGKGSIWGCSCR